MGIGDQVKRLVQRQMALKGYHLDNHVDVAAQARLFDSIKPLETDYPLIRLGGEGDGGYLVPDDLDGIKACFSPGVDVVAGFEEAMVARGIPCFQADASVERTPLVHPLVQFERKFLGIADDETTVTLDRWVEEKMPGSDGDFLLQMDIEGAEWLVLASTDDHTLAKFRIILIEFHDVERVFENFAFGVMSAVFAKLLKQFHVVHAHPNNCRPVVGRGERFEVPSVLEYTFLRKDRASRTAPATCFPHPLDRDNSRVAPPIVLPPSLYRPVSDGSEGLAR
jgi:hypothetical protein